MLDAALDALATGDPNAVSANHIAKQVGATWGAVKYQFGDIDDFWAAVLGRERPPELWRYGAAMAWVAAAAVVAEVLYDLLHTTRLSMVFLAGVLAAAVTQGARPGLVAAGVSFVIYDFYLAEPRFQLMLATPEDVLVLLVFLFVAVLTGALAGRVRDEARRAKARAE